MKTLLTVAATLVVTSCGMQTESNVSTSPLLPATPLDGQQYCRTVVSDGLFGQPAGERQHCVSFADGMMTDDANTFFGNPPETLEYQVVDAKILVKRDDDWQHDYSLVGDTLVNAAGATLDLVTSLDGRRFCRTIISDGLFGQPAGERQHCVSFADGIMTDNANTFFGNPPTSAAYRIVDVDVLILQDGAWIEAYRIDDDTLVNDAGAVLSESIAL